MVDVPLRNLKMRAESGFSDATRNGEGAAVGLSLAVALRADVLAERRIDLAATVAMVDENCIQIECTNERARDLVWF